MDFLRFLLTKKFLRHLLLAVLISLILLLGTLVWLKIYTHHGQAIAVPNLRGLTLDEVEEVIGARRLRFEVVDSVYSDQVPRGTVVKQHPEPNSKVKVRRNIFLTTNAVTSEQVTMPQLLDLSIRQATLALENAGLTLGEITYQPDYAVNSVLQQNYQDSVIDAGTLINKGSSIDLVLGMGLSDEVTQVPEVTGLNLEEAKKKIARQFLNLGAVTWDETVVSEEDTAEAQVWRQYPEADGGNRINKGMEMDIWLTRDSTLLPVPDSLLLVPNAETEDEVSF